jgi:hypothetical protein
MIFYFPLRNTIICTRQIKQRVLNLILLAQEKAVSVAEKNPENRIKIISATNNWTDPSGILPPKKIKLFLYFIIK